MIRKLLGFCLGLWLLLPPSLKAQSTKYDLYFKHWGEVYFPWSDWNWWKAQGIAESGLLPSVSSEVGAVGVMQLMPGTAKSLGVANSIDPESNIQGGIKYDRLLWNGWTQIPSSDRLWFTFGSYNAGPGNIGKALKLASSASWEGVVGSLGRVTGKFSTQTIQYVQRIRAIYLGVAK
jgi:membrane-bound lytic murein transglycosylase MltF